MRHIQVVAENPQKVEVVETVHYQVKYSPVAGFATEGSLEPVAMSLLVSPFPACRYCLPFQSGLILIGG